MPQSPKIEDGIPTDPHPVETDRPLSEDAPKPKDRAVNPKAAEERENLKSGVTSFDD